MRKGSRKLNDKPSNQGQNGSVASKTQLSHQRVGEEGTCCDHSRERSSVWKSDPWGQEEGDGLTNERRATSSRLEFVALG